jgi:TatD DNase family protein
MEHHFIDAHTHAHFAAFKDDWRQVIERALQANTWVVNVGTQKDTSRSAVETAHAFERGVFAVVGLHPVHTSKSFHDAKELGDTADAKGFTSRGEEFDPINYEELAIDEKVVAIGECGLDYFHIEGDLKEAKERQRDAFLGQIALSKRVEKPLMIHCRNAFPDLIEILENSKSSLNKEPGIIHFFTGTKNDAERLADLGFAFTFGGAITFARDYDETIKLLPAERILSETDAPYVTPVPYRGKRNEPMYVIEVVKKLAELKGVSVETMAEHIWNNALRILPGLQ